MSKYLEGIKHAERQTKAGMNVRVRPHSRKEFHKGVRDYLQHVVDHNLPNAEWVRVVYQEVLEC